VAAPPLAGVLRIALLLVITGFELYLVWRVRGVIQLIAISVFFACALFPVVDLIAVRTRAPRGLAIVCVYLLLFVAVSVIGYLVVPSLVKEVGSLSHNAPHYAEALRRNATFRQYDDRYHITATLVRNTHRLPELLAHLAGSLKDVTVGAASLVGQLITVLAVSFLLVLRGREYVEMALKLSSATARSSSKSRTPWRDTRSATSPSAPWPSRRPGSCCRSSAFPTRWHWDSWSASST